MQTCLPRSVLASGNDVAAIGPGDLTPTDPSNGAGTWFLARPQAKALHVIPDDLSDDGGTTFGAGNPFTFSGAIAAGTFDFQAVCAHEISEVMGRMGLSGGNNSFSLIDNFSYTGAGTKGLRGGPTSSINNESPTRNNDPTRTIWILDWLGGPPTRQSPVAAVSRIPSRPSTYKSWM
jgi:hypothetical protein